MIEGNKRLKIISYALISLSFCVIWTDWALLIINGNRNEPLDECKSRITLFGAGSLFGYVPLLSGVATLKRHDARRGLLLTTTVSSCILSAYDISEALGLVKDVDCGALQTTASLFMLQAAFSAILICVSAIGWFSIHLSSRDRNATSNDQIEGPANDCPPDYDSAVRDPESFRVQLEASAHRAYFKVMKCFSHPLLKNKLIIPGTNLERITMTVSIFTIVIVILQVVAEVLRVTSIDHKCTVFNETIHVWCNPQVAISCVNGFGYYLTMPSFFILIFGVQIRVQRHGISIGGRYALMIAIFSGLSFITLTALAMVDFVSFIGMLWFNRQYLSKPMCDYIVYSAEITMVIQAVLAIGAAALALVGAYIITSNFVDKYNNTLSPARQLHHQQSANTNDRGSVGVSNEAFVLEEDGITPIDPKLPQYESVRHVIARTNSLPNLSAMSKYAGLPELTTRNERRTASITSLRDISEPPQYTREIY